VAGVLTADGTPRDRDAAAMREADPARATPAVSRW
jgi:hypothetical protein